jgi:hypothetical protein
MYLHDQITPIPSTAAGNTICKEAQMAVAKEGRLVNRNIVVKPDEKASHANMYANHAVGDFNQKAEVD